MKSAVETLGPTRVRLTVEVPFGELEASLQSAYKAISRQIRVRGFRPGKVPPRLIDQQVGRDAVLEQAVHEAVPRFYGDALRAGEVQAVGQPDVEVTKLADGDELVFTAEVDVRPEIVLPDYVGLPVVVEDADVGESEVDAHIAALRDRFAVLQAAERPVESEDFLLLDLAATVDGAEVPGSSATGMSYQVGSGALLPGLDEALIGAGEGETRSFDTTLEEGASAGQTAQVTVTVRSVKRKELPDLDDEFAQTASEFDTLEELRDSARQRLSKAKRLEQGITARDRALEALLERIDVPLPESVVKTEADWRLRNIDQQLEQAGLSRADYLDAEARSAEQLDEEIAEAARRAVKTQFVLEAVASKEQVAVSESELTDHIVRRARQAGVSPDAYARSVVDSGALPTMTGEIVRGKALAIVLEQVTVTDASGRPVDLDAIGAEFSSPPGTAVGEPVEAEVGDEEVGDEESAAVAD